MRRIEKGRLKSSNMYCVINLNSIIFSHRNSSNLNEMKNFDMS